MMRNALSLTTSTSTSANLQFHLQNKQLQHLLGGLDRHWLESDETYKAHQKGNDAEAPRVREEIPHDHLFRVTGLSSTNLEKLAQAAEKQTDFETAIASTKYGWFNIWLMMSTMPAFCSAITVTSATSYIFTRAQCDMQLSLLDMGTLNAITYAGMISSAMIWGFLSDTLGRRSIMFWGFLAAGIIDITAALSQSFTMLLITRYSSGFLFNGPFAVLLSYIAELHCNKMRSKVILLTSLFYTLGNTLLPILAWSFLTQDIELSLFGGFFVVHSWNLFLLATSTLPVMSGIAFFFLPESPKFLMSRGRNDEALEIFKKIYHLNTGNPNDEYPVTKLEQEKSEQLGQGVAALRGGWRQLSPLFRMPHGLWLLMICVIHSGCMYGSNTLRLWYPQLAAMIGSNTNESLCSAIDLHSAGSVNTTLVVGDEICVPIDTDLLTYLQSAIVGSGSVLTYIIGGMLINKCKKRILTGLCWILAGGVIIMLPFLGSGSIPVVAMVTTGLALTSLGSSAISSIAVELFPTSLRVMAMATFLMSGRLGTITGTITFPALVDYGCFPPFITISLVLAVVVLTTVTSCITLMNYLIYGLNTIDTVYLRIRFLCLWICLLLCPEYHFEEVGVA